MSGLGLRSGAIDDESARAWISTEDIDVVQANAGPRHAARLARSLGGGVELREDAGSELLEARGSRFILPNRTWLKTHVLNIVLQQRF
jgi:hypothetical protein